MKEADIRSAIITSIKARGARPIKYFGCSASESGVSDLLVCYRGRFVIMETKKPGEYFEPIQEVFARSMYRAGAIGGETHSVTEAHGYLDQIDRDFADAESLKQLPEAY